MLIFELAGLSFPLRFHHLARDVGRYLVHILPLGIVLCTAHQDNREGEGLFDRQYERAFVVSKEVD